MAKCLMSPGATPISFSDSTSGFFMYAVIVPPATLMPLGIAARRSALPVSHSIQPCACLMR